MKVITLARKPVEGSVSDNVLKHGSGCLNVKASRIPTSEADAVAMERCNSPGSARHNVVPAEENRWGRPYPQGDLDTRAGRWPANMILQGAEVVADLSEQSGVLTSGARDGKHIPNWRDDKGKVFWQGNDTGNQFGASKGTAARFFKQVDVDT